MFELKYDFIGTKVINHPFFAALIWDLLQLIFEWYFEQNFGMFRIPKIQSGCAVTGETPMKTSQEFCSAGVWLWTTMF